MNKKKKAPLFFQKLGFKYRLSVLNENTLAESWHIRLSRWSLFLYISLFILITFVILALLIIMTPIRYYLPGYGENNQEKIIYEAMRVDSLEQQLNLQNNYISVLKDIMVGNITSDSIAPLDSLEMKDRIKILGEKSERERIFIEQYEKEEKHNLITLDSKMSENFVTFFTPVRGVLSTSFDVAGGQYGVELRTSVNEAVKSILNGTIIYSGYTFDNKWVIHVQHDDNFLSIYKNNIKLLKKKGDKVKAGESIAITGDIADDVPFIFEIWKQGKPINPEEIITF